MSDGESENISQQLIAARCHKGMELEDVHRATGISLPVLQGFEAGKFDVVEEVFTRLALSTYAVHLGLDERAVIRDFEAQYAVTAPRSVRSVSADSPRERAEFAGFPIDVGVLRVIGLVGGALVILLLVISHFDGSRQEQPLETAVPNASQSTPSQQGVRSDGAVERSVRMGRESVGHTDALAEANSPPEIGAQLVGGTDLDLAIVENETNSRVVDVPVNDRVATAADPTLPVESGRALSDPPVGDEWLVLQIEAVDSTWVQVKWDESGFFDAIVPPGRMFSWQAREFFIVHSGKAHGMRYTFQGELLGGGNLGDPNKVLRFLANAEGVVLLGSDFEPLQSSTRP